MFFMFNIKNIYALLNPFITTFNIVFVVFQHL